MKKTYISKIFLYIIFVVLLFGAVDNKYIQVLADEIIGPILTFTDDVAAGPVKSNTIKVDWGDATVKKWNYDTDGVCSINPGDYPYTGESDAVAISAGVGHNCVLKSNGNVFVMGLISPVRQRTTQVAMQPLSH